MKHKYNIGQLVEIDNGVRMIVQSHEIGLHYGLYAGIFGYSREITGIKESALSPVHNPTYREPS